MRRGAVAQGLRLAGERVVGKRLRVTLDFFGRHGECGVAHAERTEEALIEIARKRHASDRFDRQTEHVKAEAVLPRRTRLVMQWQRGQLFEELAPRPLSRGNIGRKRIARVECGGAAAITYTGGVTHQILDRHRAHRRDRCRTVALRGDPHARKLRQVLGDRLVHHQPPFFT
ncbi:hypothetical protein D3C83_18490 [compost metagenome]